MTLAGAYPAHAMAQVDAIPSFRALHWPMMDREDHAVPLAERHHLSARLLARSLLREHEFTAREVVSWHRQEEGDLQREDVLTIEILMQAVVIALAVVQEEWRWPGLAGAMAALEKGRMVDRIAHLD